MGKRRVWKEALGWKYKSESAAKDGNESDDWEENRIGFYETSSRLVNLTDVYICVRYSTNRSVNLYETAILWSSSLFACFQSLRLFP